MSLPQRTSSRLVRTERQRLLRQTFSVTIIAILILLFFVFVALPGFIRIVNRFLDQPVWQQVNELPPQPPLLSAPPNATNSAQLKLVGFGEPEATLIVVLNAQRVAEEEIPEEGEFEINIELDEGENMLSAYLISKSGVESNLSREYLVLLDTEPPMLEIESPEPEQRFEGRNRQDITIKGLTDEQTRVYINDRLVMPGETGEFSTAYRLNEGENTLQIKAEDRAGNVTEVELVVYYQP
jgi:bacillopeptidase F